MFIVYCSRYITTLHLGKIIMNGIKWEDTNFRAAYANCENLVEKSDNFPLFNR